LEFKRVQESTVLWYSADNNEKAKALKEELGDTPYAYCSTRQELFNKLEVSIRVTLIVSDEDGFDLVRTMISGINFNKSICNVIFNGEADTTDLQAACTAFNKKKVFKFSTSTDATIAKASKDQAALALTDIANFKKE